MSYFTFFHSNTIEKWTQKSEIWVTEQFTYLRLWRSLAQRHEKGLAEKGLKLRGPRIVGSRWSSCYSGCEPYIRGDQYIFQHILLSFWLNYLHIYWRNFGSYRTCIERTYVSVGIMQKFQDTKVQYHIA